MSEEVRALLANPSYPRVQQAAAAAVQTYMTVDCRLSDACKSWAEHYNVDWRDVMTAANPYVD